LSQACQKQSPFGGEVEADESYFGARRLRGKRGRGAGGKTIVFGLLKRGECVHTEIVPDASKATLQAIIRGKVDRGSVLHTDGWRGYDGVVDMGLSKHFRVNHGQNEFVRGSRHVNGIESFWSYAKHRLSQFHGIRQGKFALHLKETEFRFNHRHQDLYQALLKLLRNHPL
jgi:transposase-like protein